METNSAISRAEALYLKGDFEQAEDLYNSILATDPGDAAALYGLGMMAWQAQELADAEDLISKALLSAPYEFKYCEALSRVYLATDRPEQAIDTIEKFHAEHPECRPALAALCNLLLDRRDLIRGMRYGLEYVGRNPQDASIHAQLSTFQRMAGDTEGSIASLRRAVVLAPENPFYHSALINTLTASDRIEDAEIYAEALRWDAKFGTNPETLPLDFKNSRDAGKRLRLGFISRTFNGHTTATLMLPLLEGLRREFELFLYDDNHARDSVNRQFKRLAHHWRHTAALSEADAAGMIRSDGVDVLVDISGHFDMGRLRILSYRPAPVQIHYYGSACSLGSRAVDYRISDPVVEPPEMQDAFSSEKVLRLPSGFHTYRPVNETAENAPPPCGKNGHITFGTVASLHKISASSMRTWARILAAIPSARLIVAREIFERCPELKSEFADKMESHGIERGRLELVGGAHNDFRALQIYKRIDIVLDTYPYAGVTTTCDALWMGVPVITLQGSRFISRISSSLLSRVGLESFIARSEDEYVRKACQLASDREALRKLRSELRSDFLSSPLGNPARLISEFGDAVRNAWQNCCSS